MNSPLPLKPHGILPCSQAQADLRPYTLFIYDFHLTLPFDSDMGLMSILFLLGLAPNSCADFSLTGTISKVKQCILKIY
jgi:hypothetical protein